MTTTAAALLTTLGDRATLTRVLLSDNAMACEGTSAAPCVAFAGGNTTSASLNPSAETVE